MPFHTVDLKCLKGWNLEHLIKTMLSLLDFQSTEKEEDCSSEKDEFWFSEKHDFWSSQIWPYEHFPISGSLFVPPK